MEFSYLGKPIYPTKSVLDELSKSDLDLHDVQLILEKGCIVRKRKKELMEKCMQKGNKVVNVVAVDMGSYFKLIHAGEFTLSKKFKKLLSDKNGI